MSNNTAEIINRRVDIENHLLKCYQGKKRLPTTEDCKVLALRLGTPKENWSDYIRNYKFD